MRFIVITFLFISVLSISTAAQKPDSSKPAGPKPAATPKLPDAKEIVERYVKATGGRDAFRKLTSSYQKAEILISPMGVRGIIETFHRSDDRLFIKNSLAGIGDILMGYDGQKAWSLNPIQGNRVLEGKELLQTKRMAMFDKAAAFDKLYTSLKTRGVDKIGDRRTYVVVASSEGMPDEIYYFDAETGLLLRSDTIVVSPEGDQPTTTYLEDHRDVEGTKIPFKSRVKANAFEVTSTITEMKYNVPIDDAKFTQPK